ncbi:hypothetical protein [Spirosoma sp. KNUC1025]|uniref:hypothetical protein n=1 Tax=Spirosoma sp. KNUC1025 TaxID=2894082 RepID=UPI00386A1219|nr:hypothetical protein LN737_25330 [Spirosoma sp. KNUC1025]
MKTLTTLNWTIIGLYGILAIYLLIVSNGPNSDPAGKGMMGGLVLILLIFAGLLVFLNLRESRTAIISAAVLGGLPLLLVGTNLIHEGIVTARNEKELSDQEVNHEPYYTANTSVADSDSAAATQTVLDFLQWYKTNLSLISQINLVNQEPGNVYSVNERNTERYLIYLRSSEFLTDHYLNEWETFFRERQAGFEASPQNEGPPTGFEYDLVMLTQDVDMQMDSLNQLKINSTTVHQDKASVQFFLLEDYEFRLVKQHNRWLINEILNLSAE